MTARPNGRSSQIGGRQPTIPTAFENKRLPLGHEGGVHDLANENEVVARWHACRQPTIEIANRATENWRSCRARMVGEGRQFVVVVARPREVDRQRYLIDGQDVHRERASRENVVTRPREPFNADQDERRVERDRRESIGCHPVRMAVDYRGDDRHACREAAGDLSEQGLIDTQGGLPPAAVRSTARVDRRRARESVAADKLVFPVLLFAQLVLAIISIRKTTIAHVDEGTGLAVSRPGFQASVESGRASIRLLQA